MDGTELRPRQEGDRVRPGRHRLLLVEDQVHVRTTLERALRMHGYHVLLAADAASARTIVETQAPDLLVTDVALGTGTDGVGLLIWSRELRPDLPAVLISGIAPPGLFIDQIANSKIRFLAKPFTLSALLEAIKAVLAE